MPELSLDARTVLTTWFMHGPKNSVTVGGDGAENRLTARAQAAIDELIAAGYVTGEPFNRYGRMQYTGTEKQGGRLAFDEILTLENWSLTEPVPMEQRFTHG